MPFHLFDLLHLLLVLLLLLEQELLTRLERLVLAELRALFRDLFVLPLFIAI